MKKFLVTAATADEQVKKDPISNVYSETTILNSDYAKYASLGLYETRYEVEYIELVLDRVSEVITTITRIA